MEKQHQPGDFSVPEAPPPYFPPVVSQPLGMGNSENYPMSYFQPPGMPGQHPVPVGPLAPAPYQNQAVYRGQYVQPSNFQMVPDIANLIDGILARESILSFHSNQSIGCGVNSLIVQIRGSQNQLTMSTLLTTIAVSTGYVADSTASHMNEYRSTIMFNDITGKNLMTCKEFRNEMTVSVGDRLLGIIRGAAFGICKCGGSLISVQNRNGESFFEIERKGSEYTFVRNGTTIATARKGVINGDDFGVEFSASLDTDTKAMIAAVSYNLYVLYHAETACGCSGTLALTRCFLLIPVITMLTVGIIIAIVVTTI